MNDDNTGPFYVQITVRKKQLYALLFIVIFSLAQWRLYRYAYKHGVKDAFDAIGKILNTKDEEPTTNG